MLSKFFLDLPTPESLQSLQSHLKPRQPESADDADRLLDELESILCSVTDITRFSRELCIEHARLFQGIKKDDGLAPPYESVYRESRLIGEMTKSVIGAYADAGYQEIYEPAGPQDHLGVELRFLSLLCFDESQYWSANDSAHAILSWSRQSDFIHQHVQEWVPTYCEALERESTARYYKIIAKLTCHALEHDNQILDKLRSQSSQN